MSKKIVAFILILPLVLMMTLFSAVKTVSLSGNTPVAKIEILGEKFVTLDMDKNERYYVDYVIYPTVAVNKKVLFSCEQVGTKQLAQLEYEDGYIYPKQAGVANVYFTTADGGFRDKIQVVVKATKLKEIKCSVDDEELYIGQTMQINTEFIPSSATNKALDYIVSNQDVITVSDEGLILAKAIGTASVIVRSLADQTIEDVINITVKAQGEFELATSQKTVSGNADVINMTSTEQGSFSFEVCDENGNNLDGVINAVNPQAPFTDLGNGNFKFDFVFVDTNFYGTVVIKFVFTSQQGNVVERECHITRVESFVAQFTNQDEIFHTEIGEAFNWKNQITILPSDTKVEYSVSYSNDNLAVNSVAYWAKANKMGVTEATITIKNAQNPSQIVTLTKSVYIYPEEIYIQDNLGVKYGIEEILTIGKYKADGSKVFHNLPSLSFGGEVEGQGFDIIKDKIKFETSAPQVKVEQGKINILDDNFTGLVDIKATIDMGGEEKCSENYKVRCVGNGVEVNNFLDLYWATKHQKVVVLTNDIDKDFGIDAQGNPFFNAQNVDKIESTYDTKYYQNIGNSNTQIITLLQFRADLYGNGHVINANNVTKTLSTGGFNADSLFKGPLNFVAMSDSGSSLVSVKGQDNVCFALFKNTKINNVELKGCTLQDKDGTYNLTDLDYVGTVVEVFGDNVNIEYSRINNGRTVLRAFGDAYDSTKTIRVNVKNSVLSIAREFIVRIGSNLIVRDTNDDFSIENYQSPYLDNNFNLQFPTQQQYALYDREVANQYEQKYIKTYVNIENSVLKDSGIFCVGMETHFAGPMLVDAEKVFQPFKQFLSGWQGLSGTSYGAKLTFNGDVRLYDWKNIKGIDSSTLIENNAQNVSPYNKLKLDVKEMVEKLNNTPMIFYDDNGEQFVHGGIVFFGGGKNYSVFEHKGESFKGLLPQGSSVQFEGYSISLKDVGKEDLQYAAGDKPFYFNLYDKYSAFTPLKQQEILKSNAYNCIYFGR